MTLPEARKKKKLTQKDFAKIIGVSQSLISKIENGAITPSPNIAIRIAAVFNLPPDQMWAMLYARDAV